RGLRPRSDFAKAVGIEKPRTLAKILAKAQPYIQYEEREAADSIRHSDQKPTHLAGSPIILPESPPQREGGKKKNDKPRGPPSLLSSYTPLSVS
ncbi:hypothetical protein A2U01_0077453, partial [Trifolium medium]|nr:hypothetical protein [Trifolium medium]